MKKVLIVSPRFPPVNAPDHQRVRMALPYFRHHGWQPTVLCVDPEYIESAKDPYLLKTIPGDVTVESVSAISQNITRKFGFGGLTWRAKRSIDRRARQLLAKENFDLVYFSTTEFGLLPLAAQWKRKFAIPYVLDIHDPWVNNYYRLQGKRPPGGYLKHRLTQEVAKFQESATLRDAAHITTVSQKYQTDLLDKYPFLSAEQFTVLPFAGPEHDFSLLDRLSITIPSEDRQREQEWVYIGCLGSPMHFALRAFFCSVRNAIDSQRIDSKSLRIRLFGTDYAPAGKERKWSRDPSQEFGLDSIVSESPARLPYFETLQRLTRADAIFVPGSDDPGYTASKIYPYILAKRPLLTLFHKQSSVNEVINNTKSGTAITFDNRSTIESVAEETYQRWFLPKAYSRVPQTDWQQFAPYTARAMTSQLVNVFDRVLSDRTFRIAS